MYKQNKILKQTKGITLIALVITIIVLLILAAVSIATLTRENGILGKSEKASETTKDVTEDEQVKLAVEDALIKGTGTLSTDNIKEALENEFGTLEEGQLTGEGPWTFTGKRKTYEISGEGSIKEVKQKTVADLVAGDWVIYESPKGEIPCRVLYDADYNSQKGTNYGIQIIPVNTIDEKITLLGLEKYNNAITILNDATQKYKNTDLVESVRCVGSVPDKPDSEGELVEHHSSDEFCIYDGYTQYREVDENYKIDCEQMIKYELNKPLNEQSYWFASREGYIYEGASVVYLPAVAGQWYIEYSDYENRRYGMIGIECDDEWSEERTCGIRPVFKLKEEVKIVKGDGASQETAYRFH